MGIRGAFAAAAIIIIAVAVIEAQVERKDPTEAVEPVPSYRPPDDILDHAMQLAHVSGEPSKLPEFQSALECILAADGNADPPQTVHALIETWENQGKERSLLEIAEARCRRYASV